MALRDDSLMEEGGEGYFASVSDLMVGVLFIFLLMLTVFALNYRDDSATLDALNRRAKAAEAHAMRLLTQNEALRGRLAQAADALARELSDREAQRATLLRRVAERLEAGHVSFTLDDRSGVLHLTDAIPFATGRSDLSDPHAQRTTAVLGQVLADTLPCFTAGAERRGCQPNDTAILEAVLVEGHTDSQPFPSMTPTQSQSENDRLSAERALTVFTHLREQQPTLEMLRNASGQKLLGISGYGQRRPLSGSADSDADDAANRRIDLRFVLASRTSDEVRKLLHDIEQLRQEQQ